MVKKVAQYTFLYTYMDLWIKRELNHNLMLEEILFDFGHEKNNSIDKSNNTEEIRQ